MSSPAPDTPPPSERGFDGVSHGYAPDGRPVTPPPVPLDKIVGDVVDDLRAAAEAEVALFKARGALAYHGTVWSSAWGFIALCALLVAMLALAFGAILVLAQNVGPLLATLIVVALLLLVAGLAAWRARTRFDDVKAAFRDDLLARGEE
ncbi:phage holin family protein [Sphingopyxis sp. 113P3]|uniref:phage holin family protein n=1 Tax=Sphingopyxis sp. (strain 113P3) TaxID=292913 RepID=UPI0006AD364A|nr:phage holin family protein [Sphingopyxis sp. 113P3]ALC11829.1 hypothetical protein LH20_07675 [Sphingopyxis sp. 113P3]